MTEPQVPEGDEPPPPELQRPRRLSPLLVWLVPLVAALAGLVLVMRALLSAGPTITITFSTAEGLEPGKTAVKYKEVEIGRVRGLSFSDDYQHVVAKVDLSQEAGALAVEDTRFWVVRPRVDTGGVSGLGTLLSGAYIGVDVGKSKVRRRDFEGLEVPPAVTNDRQGRRFQLRAEDQGSLDIGSLVYYRRIPVGRVVATELDADGTGVTMQVFVDAPYDRYVTQDARFWNASGVDLRVGANGLRLNTQSLASVIVGGVAFQPGPDPARNREQAEAGASFVLHPDMARAMAPPDGTPMWVRMRFEESLRGLGVGAPVDFRGIELGQIESIEPNYDGRRKKFSATVVARLYPARLGPAFESLVRDVEPSANERAGAAVFSRLVADGLRAQMRTGNLITGQLYVALDFFPGKRGTGSVVAAGPFEIPTQAGSLSTMQAQITDIVRKIDEIPFGEIGRNARDVLDSADRLLRQLDSELAPEARKVLGEAQRTLSAAGQTLSPDGGVPQDLSRTLGELERTARSLRGLADYLQRHPESLIFGKPRAAADPAPSPLPPESPP